MENIVINTEYGYQELKPAEGFLITSYKEGVDDIKGYYSTTEVDAPMDADITIYRAVTLDQDKVYKQQKEETIALAEEEEKKAREMERAKRMKPEQVK